MTFKNSPRVFKHMRLRHLPFIARLFGRKEPWNAFAEINNALAAADRPAHVDISLVKSIYSRYGRKVLAQFKLQAGRLYAAYLRSLFRDLANTNLTQSDLDDLSAIKQVFQLPDGYIAKLDFETGRTIYHLALSSALADEIITQDEKNALIRLGRQLNLDEETTSQLYYSVLNNLIAEKIREALSDGELSPDEEQHIRSICNRFRLAPTYTIKLQNTIQEARRIWHAKHGELIPIETDIILKRGEKCYGRVKSEWWEVRRNAMTRLRTSFVPDDLARPIELSYAPIVEDCLTQIDIGVLHITNKRIIFVGRGSTISLPYSKLIDCIQYRDGMKIDKETGRSPYLICEEALFVGALVNRMLLER